VLSAILTCIASLAPATLAGDAPAARFTQAAPAEAEPVEDEVRRNVLSQELGTGTVADLALPPELVDRIVDRIVRASFEERYGIVVADAPEAEAPGTEERPESKVVPAWVYGAGYAALAVLVAAWLARGARRSAS
jgi:hypothetical protein